MSHFPADSVPCIYRTYDSGVHCEIPENAGRQKYMDGVAGRAWTGMMDEVPLHKDSKLFRPYSGIKSTGIRSFFDSVFVKKLKLRT